MSKSAISLWMGILLTGWTAVLAQVPPGSEDSAAVESPATKSGDAAVGRRAANPYEAYEAGLFDEALEGFVDLQVERPDDPEVALNVGSAHYQMRNFAEADRTFSRALMAQDPSVREQALYNLGNSAFRQGRLQEAVELYKAALELDPEDEDAKFNLEFVRDEIRRRHEEAQKRQQEQQQQQQQPNEQQEQEQQQQEQSQGSEQNEQETRPESGEDQQQDMGGQGQQPEGSEDRDQDGLSDRQEEVAENPTDPDDADSDDDGLPDGAEDSNHNGRVDPGETDPNQADTDGDGVPDSQESAGGEAGSRSPESLEEMTPEEAERYLQALQEGRPNRRNPGRGRRVKGDKDW